MIAGDSAINGAIRAKDSYYKVFLQDPTEGAYLERKQTIINKKNPLSKGTDHSVYPQIFY